MSAQKIKDAALNLFADHGYEGTSLSQIADEIGLKKQSIYSHFKSKDDLFLTVLTETFELEVLQKTVDLKEREGENLKEFLFLSLNSYIERFQSDLRMKFWLRVSFFPPAHLYEEVMDYLYKYMDEVDSLYLQRFELAVAQEEMRKMNPEVASMAYSALIDSICVELVYGGTERSEKKLNAAWLVYWSGITRLEN